jgi:hypothetical protein
MSNVEYWLYAMYKCLEKVQCATEGNIGHMTLLQQAINKANAHEGDTNLIEAS